jgi:hypothetical protein
MKHSMGNNKRLGILVVMFLALAKLTIVAAGALGKPGKLADAFVDAPLLDGTGQSSQARLSEAYGKLPVTFESNCGQTDSRRRLSRRRCLRHEA